MNKQYEYNGRTYKLKPLTLGLMKDIMPLFVNLKKLVYKYTNDIDMTDVNKARHKIADLEKAKEQLSAQLDGEIPNDERLHIINRMNCLGEKINLYKTEIESDKILAGKIKLYNECSAIAVMELLSNEELIIPAINCLIESGDGELIPGTGDPAFIQFVSQVLTDFFLLIKMNRRVSTG